MSKRPPTAVFKCRDNSVINTYEQTIEKLWEEFQKRAEAKALELGKELAQRTSYDGVWITGYVEPNRLAVPPAGWRRDTNSGFIMPHLRSKLGKQIGADLNAISYHPPGKPGLPKIVWGDGFMGPFNLKKIGEDWYAYVTVPLGDRDPNNTGLNEVDPALWEPVKMSTYYNALEAEGIDE